MVQTILTSDICMTMPRQDAGYKLLFAHWILVQDFLSAFFPHSTDPDEDPLPGALQKISGSWIDERKLLRRENDIAWLCEATSDRCRHPFILLIEFQTHPDPIMAVRLASYESLLLEEIHRTGKMTSPNLPLVFPVVLYNGLRSWNAPTRFDETRNRHPKSLVRRQTQSEYFLIDQLHLPAEQLPSEDNLFGILIRIERSESPHQATRWLRHLAQRLQALGEKNFQKSVVSWLTQSFLPTRMPDIELRELHTIEQIIMSIDNNTMDWSVQYIEQGREQGLEQGLGQGLEQGRLRLIRILTQMLTRKFGSLPSGLVTKLDGADTEALERIADALLDMDSLEELEEFLP